MIEFYAEIGANFVVDGMASYEKARYLIHSAANIGCTGVKFQFFKAETLYDPKYTAQIEVNRDRELPAEWIPELYKEAQSRGLKFGLSVFDIETVEKVKYFVDYYKIASYEMLWKELIDACYATGKTLMLSLGLITKTEMLSVLPHGEGGNLHILHCCSKYPAKPEECNLAAIDIFGLKTGYWNGPNRIGWSDHSRRPEVIWMAIVQGATLIEFHLDTEDGNGAEFNYGHCWKSTEMYRLIKQVRVGEEAIGTSDPAIIELQQTDRNWRTNPDTGRRG